jgi:cytosine/creatinine deaminase
MQRSKDHNKFMNEALKEAKSGLREGGLPIGSVLVHLGNIVGRGHNRRVQKGSVILHAEMDCLENAGRKKAEFYKQCVLYSTLSPCDMCSGAVLLCKIPVVVIGENSNFKGPEDHLREKGVEMINLNNPDCIELMRRFIKEKPELWSEDISI